MQPFLFSFWLKTVLLLIKNIVQNCKPDSIPQTKPYPTPILLKGDSQAEGKSLNFFVLIYCCVYLGGVGG